MLGRWASDSIHERRERVKVVHDKWVVTATMKGRMKEQTGKTGLTKDTAVDLPSKPLDAVSLLIHAPEIVSPCRKKDGAKRSGSGHKTKAVDELDE